MLLIKEKTDIFAPRRIQTFDSSVRAVKGFKSLRT
jgi:hypothetical protein